MSPRNLDRVVRPGRYEAGRSCIPRRGPSWSSLNLRFFLPILGEQRHQVIRRWAGQFGANDRTFALLIDDEFNFAFVIGFALELFDEVFEFHNLVSLWVVKLA